MEILDTSAREARAQAAREALDRAVVIAGGKTALMRKLNAQGHAITSHNTINQWGLAGSIPAKYCPDIEAVTGVRCEELDPDTNWPVLRKTKRSTPAKAGAV